MGRSDSSLRRRNTTMSSLMRWRNLMSLTSDVYRRVVRERLLQATATRIPFAGELRIRAILLDACLLPARESRNLASRNRPQRTYQDNRLHIQDRAGRKGCIQTNVSIACSEAGNQRRVSGHQGEASSGGFNS